MRLNPCRPIEELVGANRGIVRQKLARIHCMTSVLSAARACRPRNMRTVPIAIRRGLSKCVLDTLAEYRGTFIGVMACTATAPREISCHD